MEIICGLKCLAGKYGESIFSEAPASVEIVVFPAVMVHNQPPFLHSNAAIENAIRFSRGPKVHH